VSDLLAERRHVRLDVATAAEELNVAADEMVAASHAIATLDVDADLAREFNESLHNLRARALEYAIAMLGPASSCKTAIRHLRELADQLLQHTDPT